jgi:hypothetical protein
MDQFAFVNQVATRLQVAVSNSKPDLIRKEAQELHEALFKLAHLVPEGQEPTDLGRQQAMHGLQLIAALAGNGMTSLLLDGPQLFPMLVAYMKAPWVTTGVAPIAFAVVYNLCQLNGARLVPFCEASGLAALQTYIRSALVANPGAEAKESITQKLNLALALLYQIGSPKNGVQTRFVEEGGLAAVLDHFTTSKSVLVFLSSFIDLSTPASVIPTIMNHPEFADAVDSMYAERPDSDSDSDDEEQDEVAVRQKQEDSARTLLVVQVLRNLCLLQGSADTVLPLLARFLGHNLTIADEALSALSNLSATQKLDYRYAWDSSLLGMTLSKATQLCEKVAEVAAKDVAAAASTRNLAARKHILTRVMQILRNEDCIKAASESSDANRPGFAQDASNDAKPSRTGEDDEENSEDSGEADSEGQDSDADSEYADELVISKDDLAQLIQLVSINKDLLQANQSWARTVGRYLTLLPASIIWEDMDDHVEVLGSVVAEKDSSQGLYIDTEWDLKGALAGWNSPVAPMWRRLAQLSPEKGPLPKASFDTIAQGEFHCDELTTMIAGLAKNPVKLATMFKLPSSDSTKWSTGPITVNLFDIKGNGQAIKVTIDDRVPCYPFSKPIGVWTGSTQLWLPLIEKACAKLLGGYAQLSTLSIEQAGLLLTGTKPTKCKLPAAEQFQLVLESELSEHSIMIYTTASDPSATCLIDSITNSSVGAVVASYNTALFDPRRGWDATSGHVNTPASDLHGQIGAMYKLKL